MLHIASWNVLAHAYTLRERYPHVEADLLLPFGRLPYILRVIGELNADVIALQEVEPTLVSAIAETTDWQRRWSPKTDKAQPDGCLTLVRPGIVVEKFRTIAYGDGSGHVAQLMQIGNTTFANTHIMWSPDDEPDVGTRQAEELVAALSASTQAIIAADCNDRLGGPVREVFERAGFDGINNTLPTALIGADHVPLDIIATRGVRGGPLGTDYSTDGIPNKRCPSDHLPIGMWVDCM